MARKREEMKEQLAKVNPEGAAVQLFAAEDSAGFHEGMDSGAYALPFLSILQGLSPQVQRGTPEYIEGAAAGRIINTVTKQLFDRVQVTVVRRTHSLCRWKPRTAGGGFLGEEAATVETMAAYAQLPRDDKNNSIDPEGMHITEHRNFYVQLLQEDGTQEPAVISMSRTQLKSARDWNNLILLKSARVGTAPVLTSEIWELTPKLKVKDNNQWYVWSVRHIGRHTDESAYAQVREAVQLAATQQLNVRQLEHVASPSDEPGDL